MDEGKKKEGFFKRLGKDLRLQITFCITGVIVLFALYFPLHYFIQNGVMQENICKTVVTEDNYALADVTEANSNGKKLELLGWAIRLDAEVQTTKVVLKPLDTENQEEIILKTSMGQSADVQNYIEYLQEDSSSGVGFKAEVEREKLQEDVCYEMLVYMEYEQKNEQSVKITSQRYLFNEQVYPYNPLEFVAPNFVDEQMAKVVTEGYLLGYTMEHGAWVYQYEDCLYWILDKNVGNNADENLYLFFHLNTSTPELLPEERKQHGSDNRDFIVASKEMLFNGDYRVIKEAMKYDYTLTWLRTGEYDIATDFTTWITRFRIYRENIKKSGKVQLDEKVSNSSTL